MIYWEIYNGPPESYTATRTRKFYIAIHATSNDASAENEAEHAKDRQDEVSSHYYVDNNSIVQSLDTDFRAWHAGSSKGNNEAISYEFTGFVTNSRQWWLDNVAWDLVAAQMRKDMARHGIAAVDLGTSQMHGGYTGLITHLEMTQAWGGSHTDPGPNFPMDHLIAKITGGDMADSNEVLAAIWRDWSFYQNSSTTVAGPTGPPNVEHLPMVTTLLTMATQVASLIELVTALSAQVAALAAEVNSSARAGGYDGAYEGSQEAANDVVGVALRAGADAVDPPQGPATTDSPGS